MANNFNSNTNYQISTTSQGIFEPKQLQSQSQSKQLINNTMPILIFVRLILHVIFLYLLLTSKTYKNLFDSDTKRFYIILNLFLTYVIIIYIIYAIVKSKKYILQIINNSIYRACFVVLTVLFFVYIISTLQLTYILINIDENKCKEICPLTHYFTLIQIVFIFVSLSFFYKKNH